MTDDFGRKIDYLRISLTDRCNLRCVYCMPPQGIGKMRHADILTLEEIEEIAAATVSLGVRKIRLTGGEPLTRRGVVELCRNLHRISGLEELTMTTNGVYLPQMAQELKAAGLDRVNISLDTLDAAKYHTITRCGTLSDAIAGIRAAQQVGLTPIKINTVLIGGFNDDEIVPLVELTRRYPIQVRFIELMPIGDAKQFPPEAYLTGRTVLERLPQLEPAGSSGVAKLYRLPSAPGTVGLINPLSCSFCDQCNRLRLTADGCIKPCLHSDEEFPLRGMHGAALQQALLAAVSHKPKEHGNLSAAERTEHRRNMNQIGG
jgi:cyclic pyranopterin phosphate synthase